jgi:hypothetical protein
VWGNSGRTIAGPCSTEEGDVWVATQRRSQLWRNLLSHVTEPEALCTQRNGILGLNPIDYTCLTPRSWRPVEGRRRHDADHPRRPDADTFVTLGLGGATQGIQIFGFELLSPAPYFETTGFGTHNIQVSPNPLLVGLTIPSQGARLELVGSTIKVILTNGQDVTFASRRPASAGTGPFPRRRGPFLHGDGAPSLARAQERAKAWNRSADAVVPSPGPPFHELHAHHREKPGRRLSPLVPRVPGLRRMHRFYTGRWVTGLILVPDRGLLFIGQIVDLFLIPDQCRHPK